jgi:hypothetical protein
MLSFKFAGFLLLIVGIVISYGAKFLVKKYRLDLNTKCDFESELSEVELAEYKSNKAIVNIKLVGLLIILPGIILVYYTFK